MFAAFQISGDHCMSLQNPTYLVVGISGVTRLDLTGTIAEALPDAQVITASTLAEAAEAARQIARLAGAIIRAGVQELQDSELAGILQSAHARIVLIGEVAEEQVSTSPYPVLQRPFGVDDVLSALNLPT